MNVIIPAQSKPHLSSSKPWIGRFAPSPSGPLHLGSLVAALASFFIAKQNAGTWLVRIEDIDLPRTVKGSAKSILDCLELFGLHWDGEIIYQSQRNELYQEKFEQLKKQNRLYQCDCSRKDILERSQGTYDDFCSARSLSSAKEQATRIKFSDGFQTFNDQILTRCQFNSKADRQDYIIKRRDGLFAYQLAVVVDDMEQGVNHVVRGQDILDSTPRQNFIYHCFSKEPPLYYHLPLVKNKQGIKFSKRSGALALDKNRVTAILLEALDHLGQKIDHQMQSASAEEIVNYFIKHWQSDRVSNTFEKLINLNSG